MRAMTASVLVSLGCVVSGSGAVLAQPGPGVTVDWSQVSERIAWFGTWDGALEAAEATGRPILLVSAAPHCRHISGVW